MKALRWMLVVPGAAAAGIVTFVAVHYSNTAAAHLIGLDPARGIGRLFVETPTRFAMGIVTILAGILIAPAHQLRTALALAALVLCGNGFLLFSAVKLRDWWVAYNHVCILIGAVAGVSIVRTSKLA